MRRSDLAYNLRRGALTAASVTALIAGLAATVAGLKGVAQHGVELGKVGEVVIAVSPTGYAWREGIRPGQVVDVLVSSDEGGWHLETLGGAGDRHIASAAIADSALRGLLPVGGAALLLGGLAIVFLRTHRRWAAPAASLGLLAAAVPLYQQGDPVGSTVIMGAACLVPAGALLGRVRGPARAVGLAILAVAVCGWAFVRLTGSTHGTEPDQLWNGLALLANLAIVVERLLPATMTGHSLGVLRPRLSDVAAIAAIVLLAFLVALTSGGSGIAIVVVVAIGLAAIPAVRHQLGRPLELMLFSDVREQAAAEATERERARLARELHDVPLQELVAVIRRLEIQPGAEAETEDLRALAGHLRNVATELRPPVLDDLGLPAALDYLAEQSTTAAVPVSATVDDQTSFGEDRRPPTDVELAMYRIASEAVGNAIRHSGGSSVAIVATVAPARVELAVSDDGLGLAPDRAREAARTKRLGLTSMRRRAEAIDAELTIDGSPRGTRVRVVWQA